MPSSSYSFISTVKKYHVFISFRGEDTRENITSHLYSALRDKKIETFIDEKRLEKGHEIASVLFKAIEESMISIVVFSKNYASSSWCLDELNHILHCMEVNNQIVVPVFYDVDPSDVRHQRGTYAIAFEKHKKRFAKKIGKVQRWKMSLATAANIAGWDSSRIRSESKLIKEIIKDVLKKLKDCIMPLDDFKHLVGLDKTIEQITLLLSIGSLDVRVIGIWGMGGVGKTTLARLVFHKFSSKFEGSFFLEDVKAETEKNQSSKLQEMVFSRLLKEKDSGQINLQFVKLRLRRTKVLFVLDDVDDVDQLEHLAKERDWFGRGSRIIITTRNLQVLKNIEADGVYKVGKLNSEDALQLFYSKAFGGVPPSMGFVELSKRVIHFAKGLPLALKVLGCHLCSKRTEEWEDELSKLQRFPNKKIQDLLRVSYDGLDDNEKQIFLDIACFFKDTSVEFVKRILESRDCFVDIGIRTLIDKSLINVTNYNKLSMHDLLQSMGREIVRQECCQYPEMQSRLWFAEDVQKILTNNLGTRSIQAISLDMTEIEYDVDLEPLVFNEMKLLRILSFSGHTSKVHLPQGLQYLPDSLRYLRWDSYPSKSLPQKFTPHNLVELDMSSSKLRELWDGVRSFGNLKVLNLSYSRRLVQIPNLSRSPNLVQINLSNCSNIDKFPVLPKSVQCLDMTATMIAEVPSSIACLSRISTFKLDLCESLKTLPHNICKLKSLSYLSLSDCSRFEYFPEISEPMECLAQLELGGTAIKSLPSSIENLNGLKTLFSGFCKSLEFVPRNIYNMRLENLSLQHCPKLGNFPPLTSGLHSLIDLDLSYISASKIPESFFSLPSLERLKMHAAKIDSIPASIKLSKLTELSICWCNNLKSVPELPLSLKLLDARGCISLQMMSNSWTLHTQGSWNEMIREEFMFYDCLKLDQKNMMTEFHIRVFRSTTMSLHQDLESYFASGVGICFPGNEILKWFNYQKEGSSVTMKLPQHWHDANFMGFALCVVVAFENGFGSKLDLTCDVCFETKCSQKRIIHQQRLNTIETDFGLDHVLMRSIFVDSSTVLDAEEVSFNFHLEGSYSSFSDAEVKRCGIRLIHLQDAEKFRTANRQRLLRRPML